MNFKSIIGAAMLLTLSAPLYAVPVVHGDLSSDADTNITVVLPIFSRQYSRFDAFDLSYADTVAAVAPLGMYDGWSIAGSTEAHDFVNAALSGASTCTSTALTVTPVSCGTITGWNDGDFGASADGTVDVFAYISSATTFGFVEFATAGGVTDITLSATVGSLDSLNIASGYPVNLLLFSNDPNANPLSQPVPEPGILALLSLGLIGIVGARRFKAKG